MRSSLAALLTAAAILMGCSHEEPAEPEKEPEVTVDVASVLTTTIHLKVSGDAIVYPLQQAAIVPKIVSPIHRIYVERGAHVHAGQLLVELENQDLLGAEAESRAALEQAEATYQNVARAEAPQAVHKAEQDVRAARDAQSALESLYESRQELFKQGAIALKDVNEAQVNLSQARSQYEIAVRRLSDLQMISREQEVKAAAAQRDAARGRLASAEAQVRYGRLVSPIDGVVTDRPLFAGETAAAGTPVITVMDLTEVIARVPVAPAEAGLIKPGDAANLFPPDGAAPIAGSVLQVSPALDRSSTTVEVWVRAPNRRQELRAGTGVHVEVIAKTVPGALVIPFESVVTGDSGSATVMMIDGDNRPHRENVTLGIRDGDNVEVIAGLSSGERVVTTGAFELARLESGVLDKTRVRIQKPKEADDDDEKK